MDGETYDEKSYKVLQKMDIRQEKDDETKDALLKQVYTGIAGAVAAGSLTLGATSLGTGIAAIGAGDTALAVGGIALGGLGIAGGVAAGVIAVRQLVGIIKSLKARKEADKKLEELKTEEVIEEDMGRGL